MSKAFLGLAGGGAALTANALRPVPIPGPDVPSFFGGWLAAELAPHNLAVVVVGSSVFVVKDRLRTREDRIALGLSAFSVGGLSYLIHQSRQAHPIVEQALFDALGSSYRDTIPPPTREDLGVPWRQIANPFRMRHPDVKKVRNISYGPYGRRNLLDVYHHRSRPSGRPVLLHIHGGGWIIGNKEQQGIPLALQMAAREWVVVNTNYRLSPRSTWPDHIIDLKRVLAWIHAHIHEYGGDPSFIAVTGGSAGGHLAAMVGLSANDPEYQPGFEDVDTAVQACIPFYGIYDLLHEQSGLLDVATHTDQFVARAVLKKSPSEHREAFVRASPIHRVREDAPPFFVIHGRHDTLVPYREARAFVDKLRAVSRQPVAYAELPGAQHAFDVFPSIRSAHVVRGVERFLSYVYATSTAAASAA